MGESESAMMKVLKQANKVTSYCKMKRRTKVFCILENFSFVFITLIWSCESLDEPLETNGGAYLDTSYQGRPPEVAHITLILVCFT